jgi:hypothetical protein
MARLGCLLMIIAMVALFAIIVIPVLPPTENMSEVDDLLEPLLCEPGQEIERELYSQTDFDGTGYSMNVSCIDNEGQRTDATGRWVLVGVLAFTAPFLIGLFGLIGGFTRMASKAAANAQSTVMSGAGIEKFVSVSTSGASPMMATSGSGRSLSERLQEIQQAMDAGLISEGEYERLRKEVLDNNS